MQFPVYMIYDQYLWQIICYDCSLDSLLESWRNAFGLSHFLPILFFSFFFNNSKIKMLPIWPLELSSELEDLEQKKKAFGLVRRWNSPYCEEEVGDAGKVSGPGWSGGGGPPRPIQRTVFALWRQYPRMPPADIPSAAAALLAAALLAAAGTPSSRLSFPRTPAMEFVGTLPGWKFSSTFFPWMAPQPCYLLTLSPRAAGAA